jgi:hypothetical protein
MRSPSSLLAPAALVLLMGCNGQEIAPPIHTGGERPEPVPSSTCPFGFQGARVAIERTPLGADVVIEAYGDPAVLRRRARDAAAMYGPGAHRGMGHDGVHGNGKQHGLGLATLGVPVRASEEDTREGAVIHVVAVEPGDRVKLRSVLVQRGNAARSSDCH